MFSQANLLIYNYLSKFPIIKKIPSGQSTGKTVVRLTKCVMSEQGAPEVVILDNGPQYDCHRVKNQIPDRDKIAQRLTERQQSMKL